MVWHQMYQRRLGWARLRTKMWAQKMVPRPLQLGPQIQSRATTGPLITPMKLTQWSSETCC
ncbi:hypothetical protein Ahy_B04g070276 isoform A [Arachis hypogaea]|uniref:Uncharacterized protein n=1 Tax=Arachis hypogaea TaxID=3818 RepID=A0A444ZFY8_ARAHY|nr:hypothetical protein Ahy_B04g070276 isoform A [Arachis hypogaea]